jgi:hypothetical protein
MKKSIHQIAVEILTENKRAMSVDEIYDVMTSKNLYMFKAKNPCGVLRNQMRRHSTGSRNIGSNSKPVFRLTDKGDFELI